MALVTVDILSLYSIALKLPLLSLAFTMVKFDPAVVSAATLGNKRYESVTLGSASSAPTISFPLLPSASADILLKKVALRSAFAAIRPHVESVPLRAIFDTFASRLPLDIQAIDAEHRSSAIQSFTTSRKPAPAAPQPNIKITQQRRM